MIADSACMHPEMLRSFPKQHMRMIQNMLAQDVLINLPVALPVNFRRKLITRAPTIDRVAGYFEYALRFSLASAFFDKAHHTSAKI